MHKGCFFLVLIFIFLLNGCRKTSSDLSIIEGLINTNPDSALILLREKSINSYKNESDKAFYGLLLCKALDKNNEPLPSDTVVDYCVNYYQNNQEEHKLAIAFYYKGRYLKKSQKFDQASECFIKALGILENTNDYFYIAKVYSDLGDMVCIQKDYDDALKKYKVSQNYYKKANDTFEVQYKFLDIGRVYKFKKDYSKSKSYYQKAISGFSDSLIVGTAFQEIGILYYKQLKLDSAKFYLCKSLQFPFMGTSFNIRCNMLGDVYYEMAKYDSAIHYATMALKYPATFYNQRECYRLLANSEYYRGNIELMGNYLWKYQEYADSIRILESQTKTVVLEDLHKKTSEVKEAKNSMLLYTVLLILIIFSTILLVYYFRKRSKLKSSQINLITSQLNSQQEYLSQNIKSRLNNNRLLQANARKNAGFDERLKLDKELYEKSLNLKNWDAFACEMNHAFNNVITIIQANFPNVTQKEIIWCCLNLLEVPNSDRNVLLNISTDGLYKLKQRLARKFNLQSTREIDRFLVELSTPESK